VTLIAHASKTASSRPGPRRRTRIAPAAPPSEATARPRAAGDLDSIGGQAAAPIALAANHARCQSSADRSAGGPGEARLAGDGSMVCATMLEAVLR